MIDPEAPDFLDTPAHPRRSRYTYQPRGGNAGACDVSILTPFYNSRDIFHETARSVLRQSFQSWEWLIVNDGSSKAESLTLLDQYRDRDPRIRVIDHDVNRGLSGARNTGFRRARADYIYLLDDDDLIEPTTVEKCMWHLESHPQFAFANGWSVGFGAEQYLWPRGFEERERFLESNLATGRALVRRDAHDRVGGYDEAIRHGMEDWDFWLRCADHGMWGTTVPEYLDWYRRRFDHGDRWASLDKGARFREFHERLQARYPRLYAGGFPRIEPSPPSPYGMAQVVPPFRNDLEKPPGVRRILMLLPWLVMGGSDKFNLDLVAQLTSREHEITICTTLESTNPWLAQFARLTPDIFNLPAFLKPADYPRFLLYLIDSRQIDVVFISNSYLGYQLLPFLRSHRPHVTYVDYVHMEEEYWKSGGYPRAAVGYGELLDLTLTATNHLKSWMIDRGAEGHRIEGVSINIDVEYWNPNVVTVSEVRASHGLPLDVPLIFYAARICEQKQPSVFAEVIRRLAHVEGLAFACVVAGEGPDLPALRQMVTDYHLDPYVNFVGAVKQHRMRELHAAADILFLPSKHEGLALAIYEAMAMQSVPVSADVGGQAELISPDCGILVTPGEGEVERYVEALRRLIASPSLRAAMATVGRRRVAEHFTLDCMGARMVDLLSRAEKLALTEPRPAVGRGLGHECATLAIEYTRLEREAGEVWRWNNELVANAETLRRRLSEKQVPALALPVEGEELKRLSANQISGHIGARKIFRALCFRLALVLRLRWLQRHRVS